jgi:SAM-dependent methyltransferase
MNSIRTVPAWAAVLAVLGSTAAAQDDPKALAEQILGAAKVPSGLCVHLGGVGELTAELTGGGRWLVHGLTPDAAALARARKAIAARGLYGTASVDRGRFDALPYTDNLVNLLVADDLDAALKAGLSLREVMRVLAPGGVAYLGQARQGALTEQALRARLAAGGIGTFRLVRQSGLWAEVVKPRPAEMDEWTHRAHDAAGTAVSQDTAIGPLTGPRWLAGPV